MEKVLLDAIPSALAIADRTNTLIQVNASWRRMVTSLSTDLADGGEGNNLDAVIKVIADEPDIHSNRLSPVLEALWDSGSDSAQMTFSLRDDGGRMNLYFTPLRPSQPQRFLIRAEISPLSLTERQFSLYASYAVEHASTPIVYLDFEGSYRYLNLEACRIKNLPRSELIGRKIWDYDRSITRDKWDSLWRRAKEEGFVQMESELRSHDDTSHYIMNMFHHVFFHEQELLLNLAYEVTEQKRLLQESGAVEQRFRNLFNAIPDPIVVVERPGLTIVDLNVAAEITYGYSRDELIGESVLAISAEPNETHRALVEHWTKVSRRLHKRKDGSTFITEIFASELDYLGKKCQLSAIRDITAQVKAEESLAESEKRFQAFMDHFPGLVFIKDAQSRNLFVNQVHREIFGGKDTSRLTVMDYLPKATAERIIRNDQYTLEHGYYFSNETVPHPDGSTHVYDTYKFRIDTESGEPLICGISIDITEKNEYQERLLLSQRIAGMGNITYHVKTKRISFSEVMFPLAGFDPTFGEPSSEAFLSRFHPEDKRKFEENFKMALTQAAPSEMDLRYHHPDDGMKWWRLILTPQTDSKGMVFRIIGTVLDITERKKLQEQLLQSQKMESVGRLAGGIAHDFNNLLTVIIGFGEMIEESLPKDSDHTHAIQQVLRAANRASDLTGQMLAFARKQMMEPKTILLNDLVLNIQSLLKRTLGEDIQLLTVLDPHPHYVRVDAGQMEQVILNLAVNARDAMPRGGVLTLQTTNVNFEELSSAHRQTEELHGDYVMLSVSDTGVGIDPEIQKSIFEPFFTTKEVGKGTGLGLSTCYGIIKQNNGFIQVYSEPGHGATFKIYLPRVQEERNSEPPLEPGKVTMGTETILLIEDDPLVRSISVAALSSRGYNILESGSPHQALEIADAYDGEIHMVFSDIVMPEMSGPEVVGMIQKKRPDVRILLASGYADHSQIQAKHGNLKFLKKPFTPSALCRMVREILDE